VDIRIDKGADVTIHRQLAEQIVFLIATGKLKPGQALPSVREMALRHKIHPNTVSLAYQNLVDRDWIKRHRGKKMMVRAPDEPLVSRPKDLDDLINAIVRSAHDHGFSMQELRKRLRERLLVEPPDHVLLVEDEPGMRELLRVELSEMLPFPIEACSPEVLSENQGPAIGSLIVTLPGRVWRVTALLPRGRQVYGLVASSIDDHANRIRKLKHPSLVVIVSVSDVFLETAHNVLAPHAGNRHALETVRFDSGTRNLSGADLVFCDSICSRRIQTGNVVPYHLVSAQSAQEITNLVGVSG